jgi:hypothetical protein
VTAGASRFYNAIDGGANLSDGDLVALFIYYLTVELAQESASAKAVDDCFRACDLTVPKRTASYLSEGLTSNRYVKAASGYKLQRHYREVLSQRLGAEQVIVQASAELRRLETKLQPVSDKQFLKETIDCFEVGANRATIVMCWILTLDHLIDYTMKHHLAAFNSVLVRNTDKRVKVSSISMRDDFSDIPEGKLIEFLRSAGVISNDVRKILEEKLGTRNSSAHPSGVTVKPSKVIDFVDDLVENVILKYTI